MKEFPFESRKKPNIKYLGVTSWLNKFEEEFIPLEVATKVSKNPRSEYYELDPQKIVKMWELTGKRGTKKHQEIEKWLKKETETCEFANDLYQKLDIHPDNSWAEIKVHSDNLQLSGIIDIIQGENNTYYVHDIKTFKKVTQDKIDKTTKQILIYCVMLDEVINDKNIKIRPGKIINLQPVANISEKINLKFKKPEIIDINRYLFPQLSEMIDERFNEI